MGKATIVAHKGRGLYTVTINKDETGYTRNISNATDRLTELTGTEIPALTIAENEKETEYGTQLGIHNSAIISYNADPSAENEKTLKEETIKLREAKFVWDRAKLELQKAVLEKDSVTAYKTAQEQLKSAAAAGITRDIWCGDLTTSLVATQVVGTFDIANESFNNKKAPPGSPDNVNTAQVIIRPTVFSPGNQNYSVSRDGIERPVSGDPPSGAVTFWNWAVKPAWVIAKPTARIGVIKRLDYVADVADVEVENVKSWIRNFPTKPLGQTPDNAYGVYFNCPVEYMTCNARAFVEGDRVLVEFPNQSETPTPKVVGFETNPRDCDSDGFNYSRYNVVGPFANLNDIGAGWVVDTSGTPTIVNGNIDVQTHGNSRTTGGTVPDPLRFNGPYRRHFGQLQDPRLDVAPQPYIYDVHVYQGRSLEATAPGRILGVGSQDDVLGDEVFLIAALDESTIQGSTEPPNTVGFYRRTYAGTSGVFNSVTNPLGWQKVGKYTFPVTWEGLDLPFFFNSSGTECVHVHYKKATAATGTFKVRSTKGDATPSPTLIDATKPVMTHPFLWKWTFALDYTTPPTVEQGDDEMGEVIFKRTEVIDDPPPAHVKVEQSGKYVIAAEYLDNVLTVCRVSVNYLQEMKVEDVIVSSLPEGGTTGKRTVTVAVDNKLEFERFAVTGTAELQDSGEGFDILKDSGATFILDEIKEGMKIENVTTGKFGLVVAVVSDTKIQTSAMLADGESELSPIPVSQGWNVGDSYRIDVLTLKSLPLATLDYSMIWQWDDTVTRSSKEGILWSLLDAPGEQWISPGGVTDLGPYSVSGHKQSLAAAYCYLDPRYGTALLHIMRRDDKETPAGPQVVVDSPSEGFVSGGLIPDTKSPYRWDPDTGMYEYYAVYTAWGEAHRFEDQAFEYPNDLATWELAEFQNISGFTHWFWDFVQPNVLWTGTVAPYTYHYYEAPEMGAQLDQMTASALYQNQYIWWPLGQKYETLWEGLQSANHGWQDWTEKTSPIAKLFSYWYTGQPYQWEPRFVTAWYNNFPGQGQDKIGVWFSNLVGVLAGCSSRAYVADLKGFTTCVVGTRPFQGNVATTDTFDVFVSGFIRGVELVRDEDGFLEERKIVSQTLGFLSGEGSDLGDLTTLLGGAQDPGVDNFWFPLGVAPRNVPS